MSIEVLWDELNILTIEKDEDLYYSYIDIENLKKARKNGFPMYLLKQITVISDELPVIVTRRLPKMSSINKKINLTCDTTESEVEQKICEFINESECKRPTDKFSIKIDIN